MIILIIFPAVQSSKPTRIHSAILFIDTLSFKARHNTAHSLNGKPFMTIIASNVMSLIDLETACINNIIKDIKVAFKQLLWHRQSIK